MLFYEGGEGARTRPRESAPVHIWSSSGRGRDGGDADAEAGFQAEATTLP